MRRINSSCQLQTPASSKQLTDISNQVCSLVCENEKLHQQNQNLIKELGFIKQDYERMTNSGVKTVKNCRRKKPVIDQHLIESQEKNQAYEEIIQQQCKKIEKLVEEIDILTRTNYKLSNQVDTLLGKVESQNKTLSEHNLLKQRLEQTERVVQELERQLDDRKGDPELDRSAQKIQLDSTKIKSLTETNSKLNKLLEERLDQIEQLTRLLNQANQNHMKEIEKYEMQLREAKVRSMSSQKGDSDKQKLQKEVRNLQEELKKKQKQLEKSSQDIQKYQGDLSALEQRLTDQFVQISLLQKQNHEKEEQIKGLVNQAKITQNTYQAVQHQTPSQPLQQQPIQVSHPNAGQTNFLQQFNQMQQECNAIKANYQSLSHELNNSKYIIQQLNDQLKQQTHLIMSLQSKNLSMNDEIIQFKQSTTPISTRTNQQVQDSPFRRQNLHQLFYDESIRSQTSKKHSPPPLQQFLEAEKRVRTTNKDRFLLND